ncbi:MAG: isoleucine--tRNA ligase, partial [Candidatus Altiarchaeota archaeon]|nr:isoleucine--tRNA ligase [Candidatus Altiarchaeota archaeon]
MAKELDLPKLEEKIQKYWNKENIYKELVESRKSGPKFYFCQGPPFTSGHAHIGHAWNHTIKDSIIRYKSMQGFDVFRRAGWDMHGLPTEVKVEEEVLGSKTKKDIQEYGIENFIKECKKFSINNMNVMTKQLKRFGVWLDWDDPYQTMDARYMEGVWFCIKKAHEKGLLYKDNRVIHWCPRCETAMSGYEVRDEYRNVTDHSIYVKARVKGRDESILIWTTTPWTLPANTAIAAHPEFDYVRVKVGGEVIVLAKERVHIIKDKHEVIEEFKGKKLDGIEYEPMLDIPAQKDIKHRVVMAPDLVTLEDGSGLVHIAPGHGEEDFEVGKEQDLDSLSPVDDSGRFTIDPYKGEYVRDANATIIEDLRESGNLYMDEKITHSYPHCWRCKSPLIMRVTPQWFLAVSKIRDRLLEKNREIEWIPQWIGSGRFENWLQNVKDWCISRQRYWNTPLPIWTCDCGNMEVIGSIEELCEKSIGKLNPENIDLHMPSMDAVRLGCVCGLEMTRVPDVMDVWLDSGCASWANLGYPHKGEKLKGLFPADFITEGSDQTRGWFYSMLVCSVIAFDDISYKRVLYHGFSLDSEGKKMSKSLGNVVEPLNVAEKYGADVLRFYMLSATVPWEDLRFNMESLAAVDRTLRILW